MSLITQCDSHRDSSDSQLAGKFNAGAKCRQLAVLMGHRWWPPHDGGNQTRESLTNGKFYRLDIIYLLKIHSIQFDRSITANNWGSPDRQRCSMGNQWTLSVRHNQANRSDLHSFSLFYGSSFGMCSRLAKIVRPKQSDELASDHLLKRHHAMCTTWWLISVRPNSSVVLNLELRTRVCIRCARWTPFRLLIVQMLYRW